MTRDGSQLVAALEPVWPATAPASVRGVSPGDESALIIELGNRVECGESLADPPRPLRVLRAGERWIVGVGRELVAWERTRHTVVHRAVIGGWANAVAVATPDRTVALGMQEGELRLVDTASWEQRGWHASDVPVTAVALSTEDQLVATGDRDGRVRVWRDGNMVCEVGLDGPIEAVALHPRQLWACARSPIPRLYRFRVDGR
jgi:hypothetical protein